MTLVLGHVGCGSSESRTAGVDGLCCPTHSAPLVLMKNRSLLCASSWQIHNTRCFPTHHMRQYGLTRWHALLYIVGYVPLMETLTPVTQVLVFIIWRCSLCALDGDTDSTDLWYMHLLSGVVRCVPDGDTPLTQVLTIILFPILTTLRFGSLSDVRISLSVGGACLPWPVTKFRAL